MTNGGKNVCATKGHPTRVAIQLILRLSRLFWMKKRIGKREESVARKTL